MEQNTLDNEKNYSENYCPSDIVDDIGTIESYHAKELKKTKSRPSVIIRFIFKSNF